MDLFPSFLLFLARRLQDQNQRSGVFIGPKRARNNTTYTKCIAQKILSISNLSAILPQRRTREAPNCSSFESCKQNVLSFGIRFYSVPGLISYFGHWSLIQSEFPLNHQVKRKIVGNIVGENFEVVM